MVQVLDQIRKYEIKLEGINASLQLVLKKLKELFGTRP